MPYSLTLIELLTLYLTIIQICFAAPQRISDAALKDLRFSLEKMPGMEQEAIEKIVDYFKAHRDDIENANVRN